MEDAWRRLNGRWTRVDESGGRWTVEGEVRWSKVGEGGARL